MMECNGSIKKADGYQYNFYEKGKNIEFFMVKCERTLV